MYSCRSKFMFKETHQVPPLSLIIIFNCVFTFDSSSCFMWKQRSRAAPTMLCHSAPHSHPQRKSTWTEPSCRTEQLSPRWPPSNLVLNWSAVQVDLQSSTTLCLARCTARGDLKYLWLSGDSPLRSPSKVEVTEKKPTILSDGRGSGSPNPSSEFETKRPDIVLHNRCKVG